MGPVARLADSLEGFFAWQIEVARMRTIYKLAESHEGTVYISYLHINHRTPEYARDIDVIRTIVSRHGGTPATFGIYDMPHEALGSVVPEGAVDILLERVERH